MRSTSFENSLSTTPNRSSSLSFTEYIGWLLLIAASNARSGNTQRQEDRLPSSPSSSSRSNHRTRSTKKTKTQGTRISSPPPTPRKAQRKCTRSICLPKQHSNCSSTIIRRRKSRTSAPPLGTNKKETSQYGKWLTKTAENRSVRSSKVTTTQ